MGVGTGWEIVGGGAMGAGWDIVGGGAIGAGWEIVGGGAMGAGWEVVGGGAMGAGVIFSTPTSSPTLAFLWASGAVAAAFASSSTGRLPNDPNPKLVFEQRR